LRGHIAISMVSMGHSGVEFKTRRAIWLLRPPLAQMFGDGTVYLIDMQGQPLHTWKLPHPPGLYGYLLDNGHLFSGGKPQADLERLPPWQRGFKAGSAMEVDWRGQVLWEVRHPDHHHDARKLRNGNVILLCMEKMPRELISRIQGGLP
jgi:hypothetical protein